MAAPKRRENNFFTQNIEKYGDNFLDYINARTIQMQSINIFRNIAKGRVNLDKYGHYFTFSQFLEPCIESARSKYEVCAITLNAMQCYIYSGASSPAIASTFDYHKKNYEAYSIILQQLNNIKMDNDVTHIYTMANALSSYKYII